MRLKLGAAFAAVFLLSTPCFAQSDPKDAALAEIAKCASLTDDHARLSCFDAVVPKVKDALAAPPAAEVAAAPPPAQQSSESWFGLPEIFNGPKAQTTPQQFGSESVPAPPPPPPVAPAPGQPAPPPPPPAPEVLDSISAGVTDYAIHPDGRFTVFLDDGQIWQQIKGDTDVAHFEKHKPNAVVISRGLIGSYNLRLNGLGTFKVVRVK
jgi:hypothetical protein